MKYLISIFFLLALGACLVPDVDIDGKSCTTTHPCEDGYVCVAGSCESQSAPTSNPDAGSPPDAGQ